MKKYVLLLLSFIAFLGFSGCKKNIPSLNGTWETSALIDKGVYQQIAVSYIEFEVAGKTYAVHGDAGVNIFNGRVTVQGNKFSADDFAVTKMMGPLEVQEFEDMFLEVLMNGDFIEVSGGEMIIRISESGKELRFRKNG